MRPFMILCFALLLAGCALAPQAPEEAVPTPPLSASGRTIGVHEGMPETIESLETGTEPSIAAPAMTASGEIVQGGSALPRLLIVTDFTCEYCHEFVTEYLPMIQEEYLVRNELAIEWIFLPRTEEGELRAKIALCSTDRFDEVNRSLYRTTEIAYDAACVRSAETQKRLEFHRRKGETLGISRVPGFSLNGHTWLGVATAEGLREEIDVAL